MRFIGLDLAWSARNLTGAGVIDGDAARGRLVESALLGGDDEVVDFTLRQAGDGPALVAIDAPLVVPNATGRRPAEAEIGLIFARHHAGAHPANRGRLAVDGVVRGEVLVERFAQAGFVHCPDVAAGASVRQVLEVFPHPAIVALFELDRILKYKARPNRGRGERLGELARYQGLLRSLARAEPALDDADELLAQDAGALVGGWLKAYEDRLDGLMCAYIAHYLWRWGMTRACVFGTLEHGYITTPVPRHLWPVPLAPDARAPRGLE